MTNALRTAITSVKPEIPNWLKSNLAAYYSGGHRDNVYYPLTNLLATGNFESDTNADGLANGWNAVLSADTFSLDSSIKLSGSYSQKIVENGSRMRIDTPITMVAGRKYLIKASAYIASISSGAALRCMIHAPSSVIKATHVFNSAILNAWQTLVFVYTADGTEVVLTYVDDLSSTHVSYIDAWMIFDLSTPIGAGNEPTAAEMDAILAADGTAYWDGTRNVICNPNQQYFWADYSGNGRHGKLSNFAYTTGSNLDQYGAMFDGVDDYISIADSPATRLTQGGTLWAWIRPKSLGENSAGRIIHKGSDNGASDGYSLLINNTDALNSFRFLSLGALHSYSEANVVSFNVWQFIVVPFNGTTANFYKNAILLGKTIINPFLPPDNASAVRIGNTAAGDRTFDGQIGLCGICTRALTASEIKYLFDSTRRRYGV